MRAASPQATLQLEQPGFEPPQYAFAVTLALPGGIYPDASVALTSLQIQAATTTDVPDGTRIDEGYPARAASFTLAGSIDPADETKTVAWLFGRYSTSSPLYRQDMFRRLVTIDVNLYPDGAAGTPEVFRQFTGYVDDYAENPDGSVDFDCVDFRSNLRNVTNLGAVVTAAPYNANLTSEYAVDALLRTSTSGVFSSWPKARPSAVLAVGFRSSLWPEIGVLDTSFLQPAPSFAACVNGTGLVPHNELNANSGGSPQNVYTTAGTGIGQDLFLEHWINGVTAAAGAGTVIKILAADESVGVVIRYDRTAITVQAFTPGSTDHGDTWTVSVTAAAHYLAVKLHWVYGTATVSGSVQLDGAVHTIASRNIGGATRAAGKTLTSVRVSQLSGTTTTIEALQLSTETAPTPSYPFTPKAVLDPSLNMLQVVPEIAGDPWQTIQDIAVAELAWAGFDEAGVFRFANRRTLQSTAIDRTVTSAQSLTSLNVKNSTASVINRAQVGYTTWSTAPAPSNWVYSIDVVTKIPRKQTVTLTPTLDGFVTGLDTGVSVYPNSSTATNYSNYRASTDAAGTKEHPGPLTFTVTQPGGANKLTIVVTNSSNADAYLVTPANYTDIAVGTPWLNIAGRRVTQNNEMTADVQWPPATYTWPSGLTGAAGSRFGEVAWALTGNQWVQDADTANLLASEVVTLSAVPLPDVTNVDVMPDPRLQLTDTIHVQDPDVSNVDEYGRIFGVDISYDAGTDFGSEPTYTQTLDIRTLGAPGGWILGVVGRSEIGAGSSTVNSTAYLYAAG